MVTIRAIAGPLVAILIALSACSGSSDPSVSSPASTTATAETGPAEDSEPDDTDPEPVVATTVAAAEPTTVATAEPTTTTTTTTTEVLRPGVVARDGSVESVLAELDQATNFAAGVAEWLAAVPGQEGVLRNSRGVTLFVPIDTGFSSVDRDGAFSDSDQAAITLSDHLRVGVLETLGETVTVASGREYVVTVDGSDQLIDGRRVVETQVTTNGLIYLIDGPLGADRS